jgi:hypothetical protein
MQPALNHVIRPNIVMLGQSQMWQESLRICFSDTLRPSLNARQLAHDAAGAHTVEQMELPIA